MNNDFIIWTSFVPILDVWQCCVICYWNTVLFFFSLSFSNLKNYSRFIFLFSFPISISNSDANLSHHGPWARAHGTFVSSYRIQKNNNTNWSEWKIKSFFSFFIKHNNFYCQIFLCTMMNFLCLSVYVCSKLLIIIIIIDERDYCIISDIHQQYREKYVH